MDIIISEGFIMNKIKIFRCAVPYAVILISVILGTVFLFSAKSIQILPAKYFAVLTASMAVIVFLIVWLLFADIIRHKEAKSKFKKMTNNPIIIATKKQIRILHFIFEYWQKLFFFLCTFFKSPPPLYFKSYNHFYNVTHPEILQRFFII